MPSPTPPGKTAADDAARGSETALCGNLSSFPLTELLQFLATARKTGKLSVQSGGRETRIYMREGAIVACSSDDPSKLLGQFLVSRGVIDMSQLTEAMKRQRETRETIGSILVKKKVLNPKQLKAEIAAKAEETVYGLFDLEGANFWFHNDEQPGHQVMEVNLTVQEVVMQGLTRLDEKRSVAGTFGNPSIVLTRREGAKDPTDTEMRPVFDLVDGRRSIEQIALFAHASIYRVTATLHKLYTAGLVEVVEGQEPPAAPQEGESGQDAAGELAEDLAVARKMVKRGDHAIAYGLLGKMRARAVSPREVGLLEAVEREILEALTGSILPPSTVPVLTVPHATIPGRKLPPLESFLTQVLDSNWDVESILWVTPARPIETIIALKSLLDRGLIELRQSQGAMTV